jgi:GNAT superfamily N-acetyltransferase
MIVEKEIDGYLFSSDKTKLQLPVIHYYLSKESYWAQNIPLKIVEASIEGSVCFGIYKVGNQIGYGRVISDKATFGYMADIFVLKEHRGKGLSKNLIEFIISYPEFKHLRRFMLATKDAHELYKKFGFTPLSTPERFMEIKPFEKYTD